MSVIFIAVRFILLYVKDMITSAQIRAARALIGWKQTDLAKAASVSEMSIKNIERGDTDPRVSTMQAIQAALETAGVIFVPENGEGVGVRLKKERQP
ncbi:helix-turn-helix domain-containing protein [Phyllobacterium bourgognense]|uniref:Helix-turn-helix protein n=1 Tax=Phyllobacterium bourgognense TaxID=314236 RepID=A0A368YL25_9HYPH|nr:helix-turn-helix transcriptional regulator [Phyllobacterium bourgognense]RCW80941.1 helix-turn-helix protein [Phyllobacterium bourgognense]